MTIELTGTIAFFLVTAFGLLLSLTKTSHMDSDSFPNRGRFYGGLIVWLVASILAVFMSFPGYAEWFVPAVYPILKISLMVLFVVGLFMLVTTVIAFPQHMSFYRREINGRSDRISMLENIRQITSQPYPITELFTLVLKEIGSFLVVKKGAVFLVNPSRREMYLAAQMGLERDELKRLERFPMGRDIISQAVGDQEPHISGDLGTADAADRELLLADRELPLSAAAIPLFARDKALGVLLVLSDKPYRFEKPDRLLLMAAAEALAGVIEANKLLRENLKLKQNLKETGDRHTVLRDGVLQVTQAADYHTYLDETCRRLGEQFEMYAVRVIRLQEGTIRDLALYESPTEGANRSESYQAAVITALRRGKMVVLNQEAKNSDGNAYINRSALLCPFTLTSPGEYALLLEAPGNGLPLTDQFLADIEIILKLVFTALTMSGLQSAEKFNHTAVRALSGILKLRIDNAQNITGVLEEFRNAIVRMVPEQAKILIFIKASDHTYRLLRNDQVGPEIEETIFTIGEGPIGKAAATGDILEYYSRPQVQKAWNDLDPVNQDFLNYVGGENDVPNCQINIPLTILNETSAVVSLFAHTGTDDTSKIDTGMLLLAAQLLSIRLSMIRVQTQESTKPARLSTQSGHILNDLNNSLAGILGQADLLGQQPDLPGPIRYSADMIMRAAEQAAEAVKALQSDILADREEITGGQGGFNDHLGRFLENHRVTGNLYMFEDNQPVRLQHQLVSSSIMPSEKITPLLETALSTFVKMQEEGDEFLVKSEIRNDYLYLSFVRGSRDKHLRFDPEGIDFGDPDVLPSHLADKELTGLLTENKGAVSFDRFGKSPTYLSFRFPCSPIPSSTPLAKPTEEIADLKILAIDDQQMILDLLIGISQSLNLKVTTSKDPAQGMAMFQSEEYDLVMLDLAIGQVSGWDLAREVKRLSPETPVIMMTGWGIDIESDEMARAGVDFSLPKPFKIEQLMEIIRQAKTKLHSA